MIIKNTWHYNMGTINQNKIRIEAENSRGRTYWFSLFFSYETLVGIDYDGTYFVRQNEWSRTTGKLLNKLEPDKKKRIDEKLFYQAVDTMMAFLNS